jgi:hypothetical protein
MKIYSVSIGILFTLVISASFVFASGARGEELDERSIDLAAQALGPSVRLVREPGTVKLRIDGVADGGETVLLFEIEEPGITRSSYALVGEVRYENVEGEGYLETLNYFVTEKEGAAARERYFSRTLSDGGTMGKVSGDSDWRPFLLPFHVGKGSDRHPDKIALNLHLPGEGLVEIREVRLVDGRSGMGSMYFEGGWWSHRATGLWGAIGGALFGIWGCLARLCAGRGKYLAFTRFTFVAWACIGVPFMIVGLVAAAQGQPFHVFFFPIFFGGLMSGVGGWELVKFREMETKLELRKMQAADLS